MSRKLAMGMGTIAVAAMLSMSVPAIAKPGHFTGALRLVMTGHVLRGRYRLARLADLVPTGDPSSTLAFEGFKCEAIVGQGASDSTYLPEWTYDSSEFYLTYHTKHGKARYSVISNCVGQLPSGTTVATSPVSHVTENCYQFDPFDASKSIKGWGLTTTYPDGMYSETCNTPAFRI